MSPPLNGGMSSRRSRQPKCLLRPTGFVEAKWAVLRTLAAPRPDAVAGLDLPRREHYHPSPASWQDEVVYFLLSTASVTVARTPDRCSTGALLNRP